jgi:hypothetical protein
VDYVVATGKSTVLTTVPVWSATYSTDSSQVLLVTQTGNAATVPIAGGNATTVATGKFNYIVGQSPDTKSEFALLASLESPNPAMPSSWDLYLASTTTAGAPTPLAINPTAAVYGQGFTADSNFAVYDDGVAGGVGTLYVQPTSGSGMPAQLGAASWIDNEPTGSLVLFNANCNNCMTMYIAGQADIEYVDLSKGTTPTTLVTQADYYFYLTKDKSKLVYSWHPSSSPSGDAGSLAGIWVWQVP